LRLPSFTVALIFTAGCWSDLAPDSPQEDPIKTRADLDLNDDKQHPTEDDPRVFLTETHDGHFNYPWPTLRDVDALIAEVNQRGLRRLRLKNEHRGRISDSEEPELLRRIVAECPQLEDLSLSSWTFSISDCEVPSELITTVSNRVETVKLGHCRVSNSTIAEMLQRFVNLESLTLYWSSGGRGYEGDPGAVTGEGWDFAGLERLRHLDLSKCFYIRDGVIAKISQQLPLLETLKLAEPRHLTGHDWQLERMRNLKTLELDRLTCLSDAVVNHVPVSLDSMRIRECDGITGNEWQLTHLTNLKNLEIESCDSLESLGQRLPHSLETLNVRGCKKLKCRQHDYASFAGLQSLSFLECFDLDVDRLFAQLPRFARSLRSLNLVGCRPPSTNDWNLAPLNDTLHIFAYEEAEPAYVGGVDEKSYQILRRQLPDCQIFM
jgi:hypothetical protein